MIIVTGGSGKAGKTCVWDLQEYDELLSELYAGVPRKRGFGPNETLLSIEKARRVLGYEPRYSWRASIK
jgi:nucleoside-diphosphate-sugar epimerase